MSFEKIVKHLRGDSPAKITELIYYRVGPANPVKKVYLQAALHADEQPGILILHHLLTMLREADEEGLLNAQFVVFPMVNPLGMDNVAMQRHQGRYDAISGLNFNRAWPDVFNAADVDWTNNLTSDADANLVHIRQQLKSWVNQIPCQTVNEKWRQVILAESCDADYCFDLHCDDDALMHIYCIPQISENMHRLAQWTGSSATLLAEDSGGGSFDEVWPGFWLKLADEVGDAKTGQPVIACTLEYRSNFETFDNLNRNDAENLYGYFHEEGLISGSTKGMKKEVAEPIDLRAMEYIRVDKPGLMAYQCELGATVKKGDVIADLLLLDGDEAFIQRVPVKAGTDGVLFARETSKYVWAGKIVAKIAGKELLAENIGNLLSDK